MKPSFQTKQAFTHTPLKMIIFHSKNSKALNQEHWFSSDNSFTATNTLLCGLIWLIFRLFSTKAFVAWFTAQKQLWCHSVFYIATSSVQSWRHALFCFLLLLTEDTHNHKLARTHTHTTTSPLGTGVCPPHRPWTRMSNALTVNLQRLGYIIWQWLLQGLKKATMRKQEA